MFSAKSRRFIMRGNFEKIIGKIITDVYCMENDKPPYSQLFLLFEDNTYYEIYSDGIVKGAGELDNGDLTQVIKQNSFNS
jgi:hypothetical protein